MPPDEPGIAHLHRGAIAMGFAKLRARISADRLDVELSTGADPWSSTARMLRAQRLGSLAERRLIALSLEALVAIAPERQLAATRVGVRRRLVLEHRDVFVALAARLRELEPVRIDIVAELALLLRDRHSPIYTGGRSPEELERVLDHARGALES